MIKLVYTDAAQDDLAAFYAGLSAQGGEALASAGLEGLLNRCEDLSRFPDMGGRRADLDGMGLRARAIGEKGRLIVYVRRGDALHIVRIVRDEPSYDG